MSTPYHQPDASGHFGVYGGSFVSETLTHAIAELREAYARYQHDPEFIAEFESELAHFVGRPSPIYHAARSSQEHGGAQIFLKREDLNHTGAHKINNVIGQAMLAKRMGKPRIIAETGAGQHGVATATICARYGLECVVYMGSEDVKRQSPNVFRMKLLGATVVPVDSGSKTLKDALNEAMRDWVANVDNTFYIIGTVAGPHPYPMMVRDFQSVIGNECLVQMPEMLAAAGCRNDQPDAVLACVGGGSNAIGIFYPYIEHAGTQLIGVEATGEGLESGKHAASLQRGSAGVLHGNRTYLLQDENGQVTETHSISAGLDYPGVGPEHAFLKDIGRAEYVGATDAEALDAFHYLCRTEGIIPALESAHAFAYARKLARTMRPDQSILVNLSGRGDKDIGTVADLSGEDFYDRPSMRGHAVKGGPGMNRIATTFAKLKAANRKALIPYVTAGFPYADVTPELMHAMVEAGADVIELGVPFSDPMADGPVIQQAGEQALALGIGMAQVLDMVKAFRAQDTQTPVVLMGYANPVERYDQRHGAHSFVRDAAAAGVDGVLVVDYPPEECVEFAARLRANGMDLIFLLAPTSTDERMRQVNEVASGYVYYVSLKGVTGAGTLDTAAVEAMLPRIRQHVHLPVGVGFGIRDATTAQAVGRVADAVVIGSRIIQLIGAQPRDRVAPVAAEFLRGIRHALDA